MVDAQVFGFLNEVGQVRCREDWNQPRRDKLWLYNLHYFDDLNAAEAESREGWHRALIARWITDNPPGEGNGWEPYPTSLRVTNWIKWALSGNQLESTWLHSLSIQARWLVKRLEWHLLGNHLLSNAKALVFSGAFFRGYEADSWLNKGLAILRRELAEQLLPDGGHFERSPMYHEIILSDLLDLVQLSGLYPGLISAADSSEWRRLAGLMFRWLDAMTHPDGDIAFFNDAAFGITPNISALVLNAKELGLQLAPQSFTPFAHLADSGYIRLQSGAAVVLIDVGEVGPDYLPGHAHADTLSFELSLFGHRVIVNSGTSQYGNGPERLRQRGTAAHSTVQVDGQNSTEVWSGFRVARRARPFDLEIQELPNGILIGCAHDGYRRLKGRPIHHRSCRLTPNSLTVTDNISGDFTSAVALYHLHPGMKVVAEANQGSIRLPDGRQLIWNAYGGMVRAVPSTWHPEFGVTIQNQRLELPFDGSSVMIRFEWD